MLRFDTFRFDRRGGGLSRQQADGSLVPVAVGGRALDVLGRLIQHPGELVSKDEIMAAVWPGRVVEETNLTVQISALRRALAEGGAGEGCIQTVAGRGYRFAAMVTRDEPSAMPPALAPTALGAAPGPPSSPQRRWSAAALLAIALAAAIGMAAAWPLRPPSPAPPAVANLPAPAPRPAAFSPRDRRQSVIVLPFENSSDDPAQDSVATALTRDLTDRIAENPDFPLVPAATAAAHRGRPLDLQALGRTHEVHFALTGNARREPGRLVVTATLFDTRAQRGLWSQRYERPDTEESWRAILWGIRWNYVMASTNAEAEYAQRDHPEALDFRDLLLIAASTPYGQISKPTQQAQLALVGRALALAPDDYRTLRSEATFRMGFAMEGFSDDRAGDLARALAFVDRALLLRPNDPRPLRTKAFIFRGLEDYAKAEALMRRVVALDPMDGYRRRDLGVTLLDQGKNREALEQFLESKRIFLATGLGAFALDNSVLPRIDAGLAAAFLVNDHFPEAVAHARLAIAGFSDSGFNADRAWLVLIAAESLNGELAAARADLRTYLARPEARRSLAELRGRRGVANMDRVLEGLRLAGIPEE